MSSSNYQTSWSDTPKMADTFLVFGVAVAFGALVTLFLCVPLVQSYCGTSFIHSNTPLFSSVG